MYNFFLHFLFICLPKLWVGWGWFCYAVQGWQGEDVVVHLCISLFHRSALARDTDTNICKAGFSKYLYWPNFGSDTLIYLSYSGHMIVLPTSIRVTLRPPPWILKQKNIYSKIYISRLRWLPSHWTGPYAGSVYKRWCPSVCLSVCLPMLTRTVWTRDFWSKSAFL